MNIFIKVLRNGVAPPLVELRTRHPHAKLTRTEHARVEEWVRGKVTKLQKLDQVYSNSGHKIANHISRSV